MPGLLQLSVSNWGRETLGMGTFESSSFLDPDVHVYFVIQFMYHLVTLVVMCHLPDIIILVPFYQDG